MSISAFFNKVEASIIEVINNDLRNSIKEEGTFFEWSIEIRKKW